MDFVGFTPGDVLLYGQVHIIVISRHVSWGHEVLGTPDIHGYIVLMPRGRVMFFTEGEMHGYAKILTW